MWCQCGMNTHACKYYVFYIWHALEATKEKYTIGLWKLLHMAFYARHRTCVTEIWIKRLVDAKEQSITNKVIIICILYICILYQIHDGAHNRIIWQHSSFLRCHPSHSIPCSMFHVAMRCCTICCSHYVKLFCDWMQCTNSSKTTDGISRVGVMEMWVKHNWQQ